MLEMAAARSSPRVSAEGSLKRVLSFVAGEGVAGTGAEAEVEEDVGAWGAAGVAAGAAGAGVAGAEGFEGAALGFRRCQPAVCEEWRARGTHLGGHADDETLLLDLVRLDRLVVLQNLTRVDELLCRRLPALLGCDL
jgi:hypothetical protein